MTTVADRSQALALADQVVRERLVACAQMLPPITSIYSWQGEIEQAEEFLLLLKTPADRYPDLEHRLHQIHPYDEPEILALPATQVSATYLDWAVVQTRSQSL